MRFAGYFRKRFRLPGGVSFTLVGRPEGEPRPFRSSGASLFIRLAVLMILLGIIFIVGLAIQGGLK